MLACVDVPRKMSKNLQDITMFVDNPVDTVENFTLIWGVEKPLMWKAFFE